MIDATAIGDRVKRVVQDSHDGEIELTLRASELLAGGQPNLSRPVTLPGRVGGWWVISLTPDPEGRDLITVRAREASIADLLTSGS